ncbi:hypothetical protein [Pseudonocardia acidicola]|uniref:hypothetical protein n=1 Tax=Pseudonocardia acidicola TaxID=2724939 RepID=UPI001B7D1108|nr:hypothetical protein [Pseudonocardia acidicola]
MTSPSAPLSIRVAFIGLGIMGGPSAVGCSPGEEPDMTIGAAFTELPDLASRSLGGAWSGPTTGCSPSGRT